MLIMTGLTASFVAQQTVGVFYNDSLALNGYTLFAPTSSTETYLIDNCGYVVNQWSSAYRPGQSVYLLADGSLLRTGRLTSSFNSGGSGGRIERYNWDGDLTWEYDYSNATVHQHHDIAPMPNGNILILAWELISREEAIALGRDTQTVNQVGLWPEHIVEVVPVGQKQIEVVWTWHMKDHFVQNYDTTLANFGIPSDHPELIDLNYTRAGGQAGGVDMVHANSIDYNPGLDQIVLSSRVFSEIWVIDHSTSTEEAAGHTGGLANKGGDIIYRYGNPFMYGRGTEEDQVFFGQHDARWIPAGHPNAGRITVFNNGQGRPGPPFSSVDIIVPPWDSIKWEYALSPGLAFEPKDVIWSYNGAPDDGFYSSNISGASVLQNGNVIMCIGTEGRFREVNPAGDILWEYISPVGTAGPVAQGEVPNVRSVFRGTRLATDYPAFENRNLEPGERLELNPFVDDCEIFPGDSMTTSIATIDHALSMRVLGNPFNENLVVETGVNESILICTHISGSVVLRAQADKGKWSFDSSGWPVGMYILTVHHPSGNRISSVKIIKTTD